MHEQAQALNAFDLGAIVFVAAAVLGTFNHHVLKLPHVIGLTVMGAIASIGLLLANAFIPGGDARRQCARLCSSR